MQEILPGLLHWTAVHPRIRIPVSCYYLVEPGVLIDALVPDEGLEAIGKLRAPEHMVLTNRHHYRDADRFREAFGITVWAPEAGLHEFTRGEEVTPYRPGHVFPGGITAHEVGALCADESALHVPVAEGALAVADGVVRDGEGPLTFVPDFLIADTPEEVARVKAGLREAYARLLDLPWDHLLLAHGAPWIGGAKAALRAFVSTE